MKRIDDLKHDVKDVSDNVLGDLSTEERIRVFARKAAEGDDEFLEQLADTAPTKEYTSPDLEYLNGIKKLGAVSLQARHELQKRYQAIVEYESDRDRYMALMLLNESLSRLSRDAFEIDEFGNFDPPAHDDTEYAYGKKSSPETAFLGTKYRELWEDVPAELLLDEDGRSGTTKQFPNLAAGGLLAYPSDLSGGEFDDLEDDRIPSEVHESEIRLMHAVVEFYTRFHGWRIFAEETLEISLSELLRITDADDETTIGEVHKINEQLGENILSIKQDYLEAYPTLLREWGEDMGKEIGDIDLDGRARNYAEGLAEAVNLPGGTPDT